VVEKGWWVVSLARRIVGRIEEERKACRRFVMTEPAEALAIRHSVEDDFGVAWVDLPSDVTVLVADVPQLLGLPPNPTSSRPADVERSPPVRIPALALPAPTSEFVRWFRRNEHLSVTLGLVLSAIAVIGMFATLIKAAPVAAKYLLLPAVVP